jgi:hypothetical protein
LIFDFLIFARFCPKKELSKFQQVFHIIMKKDRVEIEMQSWVVHDLILGRLIVVHSLIKWLDS